MRRKLQVCAALLAAAGSVAAGPAADATTGRRVDLDLGFTTASPGTPAGMTFHILYKNESDPDGKPQPVTELIFDTPAGTRFDTSAVPRCEASDDELRTQGRAACPADSEVGRGTLTVDTGAGPPVDPVATDATVFNGGNQLIEVVTQQGGDTPLGFDRLFIEGTRLHAHPPVIPGGPPDGRTAVREISLRVAPHGSFITTPPACPAASQWGASGTFSFADGVSETVAAAMPCSRPPAAASRMRLTVAPRRVPAGHRTRIRVRVSSADAACHRGVRVRIGNGRSARTNARGRAAIVARLTRPRRYRVRAAKAGCGTATAWVRALATR